MTEPTKTENDGNRGRRTSQIISRTDEPGHFVVTPDEMRAMLEEALATPDLKGSSGLVLAFATCAPHEVVQRRRGDVLTVRPAACLTSGSSIVNLFGLIHALEGAVTNSPFADNYAKPLLLELARFGQALAIVLDDHRTRSN